MHRKFTSAALLLAATVIFTSCNSVDRKVSSQQKPSNNNTPVSTDPADGAKRITTTELAELMKQGKVYLIDVRLQDAYDLGHIPGSRLIPAGEILNHVNELPKDKMIVTYCS